MKCFIGILLNLLFMAVALASPPPTNTAVSTTTTTTPTPGGDVFGTQVQQNTSQAMQVFQNVNYKTLSGAQDQNYFFGDQTSSANLSDLANQFKLAPVND